MKKEIRSDDFIERRTARRIETLQGKESLLAEWEAQPPEVQSQPENYDYIIKLRACVRNVKQCLIHGKYSKAIK